MSIVGTRPPLISETNLYEPHHKVTKIKEMERDNSEFIKNTSYCNHRI